MSNKENFLFLASWCDILDGYDAAGKPEIAGASCYAQRG